MIKRELGKTGLFLSALGLGTVKFGRNQGVKYPSAFDLPEEKDLTNLLDLAKDLGVNTLDTAPAYGLSEERLGRLLAGQRQDWIIIGKAGEDFKNGHSSFDFTPDALRASLHRSLQRLKTDYLDIFLIHSDGNDLSNLNDDVINTLIGLKDKGLVRAVGASTKTVEGGLRSVEYLDTVMACYNPHHIEEKPVLDRAHALNKGVLLKKVLSSGHDMDVKSALRFCFAEPSVTSAIIGTITPQNLRANAAAANACINPLPSQEK